MATGSDEKYPDWASLSVVQRYQSSVGGLQDGGPRPERPGVLAPYRTRLFVTDAAAIAAALAIGLLVSARASTWAIDPTLAIYGTPVAIALLWVAMLAFRGSYDQRVVGLGTEEIRRIVSATLYTFAIVAGLSYLIRADISRSYAFVSLPLGLLLIVGGRFAWRRWLYQQRRLQAFQNSTLVIGSGPASDELVERLKRDSYAGYRVAGRYSAPPSTIGGLDEWLLGLADSIDSLNVAAVAIAPSETITSETVRQVAWELEGRSVDLLIAPAMMDISGTRLSVRPAAGLPLLHLDEASLSRPQRVAKRSLDFVGAVALIMLLSPIMVIAALSVLLSSRGPVIFRQTRVGRAGQPFTMLKFRTMVQNADELREQLRSLYDIDDPMFKLTNDPRITKPGRFLRRWSLDELPQLFNVAGGSMSLVGPRPHPLDDVDRYEAVAYRRLALKPGLTGLWQVEGRSNLNWAEALQLDLYYVESWSLSGDIVLLARTVRAVLQGHGAV